MNTFTHRTFIFRPAAFLIIAALASAFTLAGCASSPSATGATAANTSLLRYPDRLRPAAGNVGGLAWTVSNANFAQYNKVMLARIMVTLDDKAQYKAADPVTLAKLVDYFRLAVTKALQPAYPVVAKPGPGVLVVRITITDLVPVNVAEDVAYQAAPFGFAVELAEGPVTGEAFGAAPFLGHTGIVAQFFDGQTNQLIGEYSDDRAGKQFVANLSQGIKAGFDEGVQQYYAGLHPWDYADIAFTAWAQAFRAWLDRVHG